MFVRPLIFARRVCRASAEKIPRSWAVVSREGEPTVAESALIARLDSCRSHVDGDDPLVPRLKWV